MNFWNHETIYESVKRVNPNDPDLAKGFYHFCAGEIIRNKKNLTILDENSQDRREAYVRLAEIQTEVNWMHECRPYYKVWPSVVDSIIKINLCIAGNLLNNEDSSKPIPNYICVRFPNPNNIYVGNNVTIKTVIVSIQQSINEVDGEIGPALVIYSSYEHPILGSDANSCWVIPLNEEIIEDWIERAKVNPKSDTSLIALDEFVTRIGVFIRLLASDPSIIQPDVLAADRERFDNSTDEELRQRLIEKARKRGVVGWRIGESYETCPHYRRPHFALFHTGKGRTIPKILPVSGCVVHRQKITEVPTGYITPDGREIEP